MKGGKWQVAYKMIGIGWFIGTCILLGLLGGLWLDNTLKTNALFVIIGALLGMLIAFYGIYRMLLPLLNDEKRDKHA